MTGFLIQSSYFIKTEKAEYRTLLLKNYTKNDALLSVVEREVDPTTFRLAQELRYEECHLFYSETVPEYEKAHVVEDEDVAKF